MIVKNEQNVLARCLDSMADLMDEIIIVDTGSQDTTKEIAAKYTDKIYDFAWIDDFAAARNFAASKAQMDYIYTADADEYLDEGNREKLRQLKEALLPEIEIVQMYYCNDMGECNTTGNFERELRPKLYRRLRSFTWIDPIHETLRLDPVVFDSDIEIIHKPEHNHGGRDLTALKRLHDKGITLSAKLHHMYAMELFIAGSEQDFLDAVDRIVGGLEKKTKITTEEERRSIAIHEAGHASISWLLEYANPLIKVTIVPRGRALGAAWYLPEERQITTKEQMLDEMCATLGGRAAEDLFIGRISTGAMNDLERVTKQAYGMIAYLGMSDKLPNLCYYNNDEYSFNRPYSEKTAELIDEEVKRMVNEQYERAKKILSDNKEGHNKLAQLLIDKEVIFAEDVEEIFGKRPWASRSEEIISASKTSRELKEAEEKEAAKAKEAEKEVKEEESHNTGSNN